MGRAIIREPQVFLMDEPLSNLDAQLRVHMRGEIEALQKRLGVTTVYVTHDQVEAMTMGDRVAVLRAGELQQVGHADRGLRPPGEPLRRRVHRLAADEPRPRRRSRATTEGSSCASGARRSRSRQSSSHERGSTRGSGARRSSASDPRTSRARPRTAATRRASTLEATIDRVEALGVDLLGFFTVDAAPVTSEAIAEATGGGLEEVALITREGTPFCATFEPRSGVRMGDRVDVTVDVRRLHFFDPESETAIGA